MLALLPSLPFPSCPPAGIDVCGARVVKMILDCIQLLQSKGRQVTKLSFVGYSLGGLILRWVSGDTQHECSVFCLVLAMYWCMSTKQNKNWGGLAGTLGPSGCTLQGRCSHLGIMPCYLVSRVPFSGKSTH
jgi:hypothetical protein